MARYEVTRPKAASDRKAGLEPLIAGNLRSQGFEMGRTRAPGGGKADPWSAYPLATMRSQARPPQDRRQPGSSSQRRAVAQAPTVIRATAHADRRAPRAGLAAKLAGRGRCGAVRVRRTRGGDAQPAPIEGASPHRTNPPAMPRGTKGSDESDSGSRSWRGLCGSKPVKSQSGRG